MRWCKQRKGLRKTDFEKRLQEYTYERSVNFDFSMDIEWNIGVEFLKNHSGGGSTEIKNTYTKWLDEGRFFLLPNAIFTLGLSPGEMTLYAYLIFCEDRTTHQCWPSIGRISQHTGMSANTIAKYIRQLEEKQLINVEPTKVRTKRGEVRNGTLRFTIRPIQEAVSLKLERGLAVLPGQKRSKKKW